MDKVNNLGEKPGGAVEVKAKTKKRKTKKDKKECLSDNKAQEIKDKIKPNFKQKKRKVSKDDEPNDARNTDAGEKSIQEEKDPEENLPAEPATAGSDLGENEDVAAAEPTEVIDQMQCRNQENRGMPEVVTNSMPEHIPETHIAEMQTENINIHELEVKLIQTELPCEAAVVEEVTSEIGIVESAEVTDICKCDNTDSDVKIDKGNDINYQSSTVNADKSCFSTSDFPQNYQPKVDNGGSQKSMEDMDITDSQLLQLDMHIPSQEAPERQEVKIEFPEIQDGTKIVQDLIYDVSHLNKLILEMKRTVEAAKRQQKKNQPKINAIPSSTAAMSHRY